MSKKRGLPETVRMRHDNHFVDEIASEVSASYLFRTVSLERIDLNPYQPRKEFGDLEELIASVKEKGVLEPVILRPREGRFEVVAGERRVRAAREADLKEVPAVVMELEDDEALELALVENLQRKELTPFEEAFSLKTLNDSYGFSHEEIAKRLGKSRSSVTETIKIASLPPQVALLCQEQGIGSKSFLLELARLPGEKEMVEALQARLDPGQGATRDDLREKRKEVTEKPKRYVFRFSAPDRRFKLQLQFKEEKASREEVIAILEDLLLSLREGRETGL